MLALDYFYPNDLMTKKIEHNVYNSNKLNNL